MTPKRSDNVLLPYLDDKPIEEVIAKLNLAVKEIKEKHPEVTNIKFTIDMGDSRDRSLNYIFLIFERNATDAEIAHDEKCKNYAKDSRYQQYLDLKKEFESA